MANTTFNGPVRSENGFEVVTKNNTTGAYITRQAAGLPDMTGMAFGNLATGANITLGVGTPAGSPGIIEAVDYTGAAACAVALPAAISGTISIYVQSVDTAGGTATLTFNAAGTDVWATGSIIESISVALIILFAENVPPTAKLFSTYALVFIVTPLEGSIDNNISEEVGTALLDTAKLIPK